MSKLHFYVAGPMAGLPDHNHPYFREVTEFLRSRNLEVTCPTEINSPEDKRSWEECVRRDMVQMLHNANALCLLRGWPESRGALLEAIVAKVLGFSMFYCYERLGWQGSQLPRFDLHELEISLPKLTFLFIKRYADELVGSLTF